jgi:hypothetical protein
MTDFESILNPGFHRLIRMRDISESSPLSQTWDPYLGGFLETVAIKIRYDNYFFPDMIDLNRANIELTKIYKEFSERTKLDFRSSACVLVGKVGIGKTSFLNWFRKASETRNLFIAKSDFNAFEASAFSEYSGHELFYRIFSEILKRFCIYFSNRLQENTDFKNSFNIKLKKLKEKAKATYIDNWESAFIAQSESFKRDFPNYDAAYLLTFLIESANAHFERPIWMLLDNIDRLPPKIQKTVVEVMHSIYEKLIENARSSNIMIKFHIISTARPETIALHDFDFEQFHLIEYPVPRILSIAKQKLLNALKDAADEDDTIGNFIIGGETYSGTKEISKHIELSVNKVFENFADIKNLPKQKLASDKWHLALVNNNVRRFIKPWSAMILSGNFVNDLIFPENKKEFNKEFNVHRYFKLLIKGKFNYFIGNDRIDGYGYNEKSPLFFNLFGFPHGIGVNNQNFAKNYFIFIRILQYLIAHETNTGTPYKEFLNNLSIFFDKTAIEDATKILLWTRLIDEIETGARDIGPSGNCRDISLTDDSSLLATDTTKLYFHYILSEYDYISGMAMVSEQLKYFAIKNIYTEEIEALRLAEAAYHFLESWLYLLILNFEFYKKENIIGAFLEFFMLKPHASRPWFRSVDQCINALIHKAQFAKKSHEEIKFQFFSDILGNLISLKKKGVEIICTYLGNCYIA